jgi:hypothetical protein
MDLGNIESSDFGKLDDCKQAYELVNPPVAEPTSARISNEKQTEDTSSKNSSGTAKKK